MNKDEEADKLQRDIEDLLQASSVSLTYKRGILNDIECMLRQREREAVKRERRRSAPRRN